MIELATTATTALHVPCSIIEIKNWPTLHFSSSSSVAVTSMAEIEGGGFLVEALKKKSAVSRNWAAVDSSGRGTILDLDRFDVMKRIPPVNSRDLRVLDPLLSYPPAILPRGKAIIINLEHIKAIITPHEVLVRDPLDGDVIPIVEELKRRLTDPDPEHNEIRLPFEFRALEVSLEGICSLLEAKTRELEAAAYPALDELTAKISSQNLDGARRMKSAMARLTIRVQKVRDEIEQVVDDDGAMARFHLSRRDKKSPAVFAEELEMILEGYLMKMESTFNKLKTLREYINDTEDYINIQLDNQRNQLIQLEVFLSSGSVCVTIYSVVAAIFGMNIPHPWREHHSHLFKWVVILTSLVSASIFVLIICSARRRGLFADMQCIK